MSYLLCFTCGSSNEPLVLPNYAKNEHEKHEIIKSHELSICNKCKFYNIIENVNKICFEFGCNGTYLALPEKTKL